MNFIAKAVRFNKESFTQELHYFLIFLFKDFEKKMRSLEKYMN